MSKNILFVYSDILQKKTFEECEVILKAALRRFRKSADFTYIQLDVSPLRQELSAQRLLSEIKKSDAVIWNCGTNALETETNFAAKNLGVFAAAHFTSGSCICTPLSLREVFFDKSSLSQSAVLSREAIENAAALAASIAQKRKRSLSVCTDFGRTISGRILSDGFENSLRGIRGIEVHQFSCDELVWNCATRIPDFDVLLTGENEAQIIRMHMCALKKLPTGHIVWHADKARIYRREILPYEQMNNTLLASLLLSCAAAIEEELCFVNVGTRLRKCVSLALEKCAAASQSDFTDEILFLINTRIRNRQVN